MNFTPMAINKRKIGRFRIQKHFFEQELDSLPQIFAHCVVLDAKFRYDYDAYEYVALCDQFQELDEWTAAPLYDSVMTHADDGSGTPVFLRFQPADGLKDGVKFVS